MEADQDRNAAPMRCAGCGRSEGLHHQTMLTRSHTTTISGRAVATRRLRRRASAAAGRLYCRTNGCTTYLVPDLDLGLARCPVCGAARRID